jgi:hypothetical protein
LKGKVNSASAEEPLHFGFVMIFQVKNDVNRAEHFSFFAVIKVYSCVRAILGKQRDGIKLGFFLTHGKCYEEKGKVGLGEMKSILLCQGETFSLYLDPLQQVYRLLLGYIARSKEQLWLVQSLSNQPFPD